MLGFAHHWFEDAWLCLSCIVVRFVFPYRLCHTTAPMPIHLYVLIAFGMGLVVHGRVDRAHKRGSIGITSLDPTGAFTFISVNPGWNGHGSSFMTQSAYASFVFSLCLRCKLLITVT